MIELVIVSSFLLGMIVGGWIVWLLKRENDASVPRVWIEHEPDEHEDLDYQMILDDLPTFLKRQAE